MIVLFALLILELLCCCQLVNTQGPQDTCVSPLNNSDFETTGATYLDTIGVQVLLPDIQFKCSGYIENVEIVVLLESGGSPSSSHYFTLQIWRPASDNTTYTLIVQDDINDVIENERLNTDHGDVRLYRKSYPENSRLYYQKGDILGMFIPAIVPPSLGPLIPMFLNDSTTGVTMYWTKVSSSFSPCSVSLCYTGFNTLNDVALQMSIQSAIEEFQQNTGSLQCNTIPELLRCDVPPNMETVTTSIITPSHTVFTSSVTHVPSTQTVPSPTESQTGLPLTVLVAVPVGLTGLLIVLTSLLIISLLCLKHGKKMWRRKTETVHQFPHYKADDGTEYTSIRKTSSNTALNFERQETRETFVSQQELTVLASPQNETIFTLGSPVTRETPRETLQETPIEPYASLVSIPMLPDSQFPSVRERSSTISGPIRRQQKHSKKPTLLSKGSMPIINLPDGYPLDTVGEETLDGHQEPLPYIEAVGSMGNIRMGRFNNASRSESDRKISLPSRNPRISSATTRKTSQPSRAPRVSSATTRKTSQHTANFRDQQHHSRLDGLRKTSQPARLHPQHISEQAPYERPITSNQPRPHRLPHLLEKSMSLNMGLPSLPQHQNNHAPPDDLGVASPYMEPSPTNAKKGQRHKNLGKSLSHDLVANPYLDPSPTINRKFSEAASPYMEPSPTLPQKVFGNPPPPSHVITPDMPSLARSEQVTSRPAPVQKKLSNESSISSNTNSTNFIYVPPEVVSRSREPHTGQSIPSVQESDQVMSTFDRFRVPSSVAREPLESHQNVDIYSRLERSIGGDSSRDSRFWDPPSSTAELYDTLAYYKYREIDRNQIFISECLGSGHFGSVHKGLWQFKDGKLVIAVKTLKPDAPEEEEVKFLQEAAITGQFNHPNIIQLHGVVTSGTPLMIILELMPKGDLKAYLKQQKKNLKNESANLEQLSRQFISFARNIAHGMDYLAKKSFIHRDLAARNIFLTDNLTCKIGDFGMARDLAHEDYYESSGRKIPLKWTAPEAIDFRKYSSGSDVWSYGMVLFEIWSIGHKPFHRNSNQEILELIRNGFCQPPPPGCPRTMYQLMVKCWCPHCVQRPSFSDIAQYLAQPDDLFLQGSQSDISLLGYPLEHGDMLYKDLQNAYNEKSFLSTTL